jgi:hypothetical protein
MTRPAQSQDLLLMFDRPTEPIFMPKGDNNNVAFDVPPSLLVSIGSCNWRWVESSAKTGSCSSTLYALVIFWNFVCQKSSAAKSF